jgi:hypothetical protein
LPGFVQDRTFEGAGAPIPDGAYDAVFYSFGSSHELSGLVPNVLTEWIVILEVLYGFCLEMAEMADRGANETSSLKIVPG